MKLHGIIPAAGIGSRMQLDLPKQYLLLPSMLTVLQQTVKTLTPYCQQCVIAHHADDEYIHQLSFEGNCQLVLGGESRAHSVFNALTFLVASGYENDWVMVHDAARPFVDDEDIQRLLIMVEQTQQGAILATPMTDTVKQTVPADATDIQILTTLNRSQLWRAQTPQVFAIKKLYQAMSCVDDLSSISDESSAMEQYGQQVSIIEGSPKNIKITHKDDILMNNLIAPMTKIPDIRIGSGFDVHAFTEGDFIMLGGVKIPFDKAIKAHSDGDLVLHALCDAMLGALSLGDIGQHFPDTDVKWKNANSRDLLIAVNQLINERYYRVSNIDITIMAQRPKLAPFRSMMEQTISGDLNIDANSVSVKATTTEALGFVGREEGIAAQAQVLLMSDKQA